jgi:hypothetical protein
MPAPTLIERLDAEIAACCDVGVGDDGPGLLLLALLDARAEIASAHRASTCPGCGAAAIATCLPCYQRTRARAGGAGIPRDTSATRLTGMHMRNLDKMFDDVQTDCDRETGEPLRVYLPRITDGEAHWDAGAGKPVVAGWHGAACGAALRAARTVWAKRVARGPAA